MSATKSEDRPSIGYGFSVLHHTTTVETSQKEEVEAREKAAPNSVEEVITPDHSSLIKSSAIASIGASFVPVPASNMTAVVANQLIMEHKLTKAYDVFFSYSFVRPALLFLIRGLLPTSLGVSSTGLLKTIQD